MFYLEILFLASKLDIHSSDYTWKQADNHILKPCIVIWGCKTMETIRIDASKENTFLLSLTQNTK